MIRVTEELCRWLRLRCKKRGRRPADAEIDRLRGHLREAADEINAWGAYASAYIQDKHDLDGIVQRFRSLAGPARADVGADVAWNEAIETAAAKLEHGAVFDADDLRDLKR